MISSFVAVNRHDMFVVGVGSIVVVDVVVVVFMVMVVVGVGSIVVVDVAVVVGVGSIVVVDVVVVVVMFMVVVGSPLFPVQTSTSLTVKPTKSGSSDTKSIKKSIFN